ncbi:hypothetical protein EHS89_16105 [Amphritea balenae]|uniref:Uncharacterized protein n=1 Tax=Amphritea balenae TaxID=452629 RepID=A0A3P1SK82_9GAMM|nr:hypothetical protein [Amphritea balenae]RRC97703.1 hypothetical protein EHS89_16105 [Amphritea balenae]
MPITGPIPISNPNVRLVTPPEGPIELTDNLQALLNVPKLNEKPQMSLGLWEKQINTPQSTVVKLQGEIVATFGENGFQTFFKNSDGRLVQPGSSQYEVVAALKSKYGAALDINTFPSGTGPTEADIFEQMHGYRPQPPINIRV